MKDSHFKDLDRNVARARVLLSLLAMLSLYIDPTVAGGLFHLSALAIAVLACHLGYSLLVYTALDRQVASAIVPAACAVLDLFFATAIACLTEGQTSPSYVFFVFAIVAAGTRAGLRATIGVTLGGVTLYLLVIAGSERMMSYYIMRAVYLAIAGYLIGFVGQQRAQFESRMHEFELTAERHSIARSLHDGYVQALAAVNLRLQTCRELLARKRAEEALAQITELQGGVTREYDDVRKYIRSLAGLHRPAQPQTNDHLRDPLLQVQAEFNCGSLAGEYILQIMLEGLRNARRHSKASQVTISAWEAGNKIRITIDDDGIGFGRDEDPPWAIASRVAEFGGSVSIQRKGSGGLAIEVPKIQLC